MAFTISTEELRSFHAIDRDLFRRMIINLRRDIGQSMEIMALWLWLEAVGYPSIVAILHTMPDIVLNAVVEEALTCLYHIGMNTPPNPTHDSIWLTLNLMRQPISLLYLYENRERARYVISRTVEMVFSTAFADIVEEEAQQQTTAASSTVVEQQQVQFTMDGGIVIQENGQSREVVAPDHADSQSAGYHPLISLPGLGGYHNNYQESGESSQANANAYAYTYPYPYTYTYTYPMMPTFEEIPNRERTVLMTFARGYPINEQEIREYFLRNWGEVVEVVCMLVNTPYAQPVSAHVVMYTGSTVNLLLEGTETVKLIINGKDAWIRRV